MTVLNISLADFFVSLTLCLFEAFCTVIMFNGYLAKRYRWFALSNTLLLTGYLAALWVGVMFLIPMGLLSNIIVVLVKFAFAMVFYQRGKIWEKAIISIITTVITAVFDVLMIFIYQMFVSANAAAIQQNSFAYAGLGFISRVLALFFFIIWLRIFRKGPLEEFSLSRSWLLLLVTPAVTIITLFAIIIAVPPAMMTSPLLLISAVGLLVLNISIFYLFDMTIKREVDYRKKLLLSHQGEIEMKNARAFISVLEKEQELVHDYLKHWGILRNLLSNSEYEKARQYTESVYLDIQSVAIHAFTENIIIDAVLCQYFERCRPLGIDFILHVPPLKRVPVSDKLIVTILGNVLDNAVEAAAKVNGEKKITVKMADEPDGFLISVINSASAQVKIINNTIKTTKTDTETHGIGLMNVAKAISDCNGIYELFSDSESFQFTAIIPYSKNN